MCFPRVRALCLSLLSPLSSLSISLFCAHSARPGSPRAPHNAPHRAPPRPAAAPQDGKIAYWTPSAKNGDQTSGLLDPTGKKGWQPLVPGCGFYACKNAFCGGARLGEGGWVGGWGEDVGGNKEVLAPAHARHRGDRRRSHRARAAPPLRAPAAQVTTPTNEIIIIGALRCPAHAGGIAARARLLGYRPRLAAPHQPHPHRSRRPPAGGHSKDVQWFRRFTYASRKTVMQKMASPRWYPSACTLPDGDVIAIGGTKASGAAGYGAPPRVVAACCAREGLAWRGCTSCAEAPACGRARRRRACGRLTQGRAPTLPAPPRSLQELRAGQQGLRDLRPADQVSARALGQGVGAAGPGRAAGTGRDPAAGPFARRARRPPPRPLPPPTPHPPTPPPPPTPQQVWRRQVRHEAAAGHLRPGGHLRHLHGGPQRQPGRLLGQHPGARRPPYYCCAPAAPAAGAREPAGPRAGSALVPPARAIPRPPACSPAAARLPLPPAPQFAYKRSGPWTVKLAYPYKPRPHAPFSYPQTGARARAARAVRAVARQRGGEARPPRAPARPQPHRDPPAHLPTSPPPPRKPPDPRRAGQGLLLPLQAPWTDAYFLAAGGSSKDHANKDTPASNAAHVINLMDGPNAKWQSVGPM